jgi:hypothetical protein
MATYAFTSDSSGFTISLSVNSYTNAPIVRSYVNKASTVEETANGVYVEVGRGEKDPGDYYSINLTVDTVQVNGVTFSGTKSALVDLLTPVLASGGGGGGGEDLLDDNGKIDDEFLTGYEFPQFDLVDVPAQGEEPAFKRVDPNIPAFAELIKAVLQTFTGASTVGSVLAVTNSGFAFSALTGGGGVQTQLTTPALTPTVLSDTSIKTDWTDDVNATNSIVEIASNSDFTGTTQIYTGALNTYTKTALTASTLYYFRVKSQASGYVDSAWSATQSATTQAAVSAVNILADYQFNNSTYSVSGGTSLDLNAAIAVDGTLTAAKITPQAFAVDHNVYKSGVPVNLVTGKNYRVAFGFNTDGFDFVTFLLFCNNLLVKAKFNGSTGVIIDDSNCTASITSLTNGYYNGIMDFTLAENSPNVDIYAVLHENAEEVNTAGDGVKNVAIDKISLTEI